MVAKGNPAAHVQANVVVMVACARSAAVVANLDPNYCQCDSATGTVIPVR